MTFKMCLPGRIKGFPIYLRSITVATLIGVLPPLALAQENCSGEFGGPLLPATRSSYTLQKTLPVVARYRFDEILKDGRQIWNVYQSPDKRYVALQHLGDAPMFLEIIDLTSGKTVFKEGFSEITGVFFIPGSEMIAVNGIKDTETNRRYKKLYVLPIHKTSTVTDVTPVTPSTFITSYSNMFMSAWFGGLGRSPEVRSTSNTLEIRGSPIWGAEAENVVARQGLSYVFVIQDSSNARESLYRPEPGTYPWTSRLNQGVDLYDATTMQRVRSLEYKNLVPVQMSLNPKNSLAVLQLVEPIVANRSQISVGIIDANQPDQILYRYDFASAKTDIGTSRYVMTLNNKVETSWSPDGQTLLIYEKNTGTLVKYDLKTQKETLVERAPNVRWPTPAAKLLSDGSIFVLRQDDGPVQERGQFLQRKLHGYITKSMETLKGVIRPDFQLKIDTTPELFPKSHSRNPQEPMEVQNVFEMQNGRAIVVILEGQIIVINRDRPDEQIQFSPSINENQRSYEKIITSAEKISESILRLSDSFYGIVDVQIPDVQ